MFEEFMDDTSPLVMFNTNTIFDIMVGNYEVGVGGKWYLNGGLGTFITGLHGRGNTYKSTLMDSFIMGVLRNYPGVQCIDIDTEYSKKKTRILQFMMDLRTDGSFEPKNLSLKSDPVWTTEYLWKFITKLCKSRMEHKKDLQITTPFFDHDGKPIKVWTPMILFIDSFSELRSLFEQQFFGDVTEGETGGKKKKKSDGEGLDDTRFRTIHMEDGARKGHLLGALNEYTTKYGIIVCCTARTGNNFSLDPKAPPSKELTHQNQKDKIKNCGPKFTTLTHILAQVIKCYNSLDGNGEPYYKFGNTGRLDLQELILGISRNKMNSSGVQVPMILSQVSGLLSDVSYFNFLRANGSGRSYPGILSAGTNFRCSWLPEVSFTRNTLRSKLAEDYKVGRAIELVGKYVYIQKSWNIGQLPYDFTMEPEAVFDKLMANKVEMADILESTAVWAPIPANYKQGNKILGSMGREHMTLFDVMAKIAPTA